MKIYDLIDKLETIRWKRHFENKQDDIDVVTEDKTISGAVEITDVVVKDGKVHLMTDYVGT